MDSYFNNCVFHFLNASSSSVVYLGSLKPKILLDKVNFTWYENFNFALLPFRDSQNFFLLIWLKFLMKMN